MNELTSDILRHNVQFNRPERYLKPGEFFSSSSDIVISTLLGSCIAVALYDRSIPVGGLNHFLLPFPKGDDSEKYFSGSKYGVHAMELLINDILKKGGHKQKLRAKVFGGSTVLAFHKAVTYNIPKMNIDFIFSFLETERISVDSYSVGGCLPRKIIFLPTEAKVFMKFSKTSGSGLAKQEDLYSHALLEATKNSGKPILF